MYVSLILEKYIWILMKLIEQVVNLFKNYQNVLFGR